MLSEKRQGNSGLQPASPFDDHAKLGLVISARAARTSILAATKPEPLEYKYVTKNNLIAK